MNDLEIKTAIKAGSLMVCCGKYQNTYFIPWHTLPGNYIEAVPQFNSRFLKTGNFRYYGCTLADCRLGTPEETEQFNQLLATSSHFQKID